MTKDRIQKTADLLICSPVRSAVQSGTSADTCIAQKNDGDYAPGVSWAQETLGRRGEATHSARHPAGGRTVGSSVIPRSRSLDRKPCDTPTHPLDKLKEANEGIFAHLDFSGLDPTYASKTGIFDPDRALERGKRVRLWLRDRPESEIVGELRGLLTSGDVLNEQWLRTATSCGASLMASGP